MHAACPPCVACEVDGLPMDPVLLAERQAAEAESRAAVERLLSRIPAHVPGPTAALADPPARVTARERGRARRALIDAAKGAETARIGMPDGPTTGWSDRKSSKGVVTGSRGSGRLHGRVKRPKGTR